ncbi:MAG: HAMP domain-containing sensor histidine kinase [Solirubrobacterales bacterium]
MRRLRELYARSRRLPVRFRIALVSAALTAVILIGFAAVVGRLTSNRLHNDFKDDLQSNATRIAGQNGRGLGLTDDSVVRVVYQTGIPVPGFDSSPVELGAPQPGTIVRSGDLDVAAAPIVSASDSILGTGAPRFVQYARPETVVDDTINRLWLFLGGGVAIGTVLAGLAGMAVANRAMRPIAAMTAAARDIAATRDPSKRIPEPESDDEVAELARTFDQMLQELDAARTETDETIKRQREFVADASHELRTPLTSILANLELLEHSAAADADEDDLAAVSSALRSSKRMNRLVGDLLLLARADAGRAGTRSECDLAAIAEEALEELRPIADGHALESSLDGEALVRGNADELHRMVLNLLENAIRHTPEGTAVRLEVGSAEGLARLEVSDDGPGLPEGMEEEIFGRFVRAKGPADRSQRSGTGLGLAIVRAVARGHGGDVEAHNDDGAHFTVTLPAAEKFERTIASA